MQQLTTNDTNAPAEHSPHALWETKVALVRVGITQSRAGSCSAVGTLSDHFDVHEASELLKPQDQHFGVDVGCLLLEFSGDQACLTQTLETLLSQGQGVPLIVLARSPCVAQAVLALKMGAADYIDGSFGNSELLSTTLHDSVDASLKLQTTQQPLDELGSLHRLPLALVSETTPLGTSSVQAAHTVLTPLAALQEFITIVLDGVAGPIADEQGKYLAYARGACDQIRQAVDQFVGVTSLEPNYAANNEPQELGEILLEAWSTLIPADGLQELRLELDEADYAQLVTADPVLLEQLFQTLLQDLTTFAQSGEAIVVTTQLCSDKEDALLQVNLRSAPAATAEQSTTRAFCNRRQFGPWLVTQIFDQGLSYQLELPATKQAEPTLSTEYIEE